MARWTDRLDDEELAFLKRFVRASGSLKAVAQGYGVSYPTVRLRLDRLIQKIDLIDALTECPPVEATVRLLYGEGRIDQVAFRTLLAAIADQETHDDDHET